MWAGVRAPAAITPSMVSASSKLCISTAYSTAGVPSAAKRNPCRGHDDRAHPEIDAGSELLVYSHLLTAGRVPARERAVVQEAKRDGLLDLVSAIAGDKHPRGVRLVHGHRMLTP